jgi:hypothetical protein
MKYERSKLYCFSPLVMVATFTVEIAFALYTFWRYKLDEVSKVAMGMLAFLAIFQLAEYFVCEGSMAYGLTWSRAGFIAITMLPPLGLHMIYAIAKAKRRPLLIPAYAMAAGFTVFFVGMDTALSGHECVGNYVIFQVASGLGGLFAAYYYGWLAAGGILAWRFAKQSGSDKTRRALKAMTFGYAAFIVPTATANILSPDTIRGIPSIMCGFAVILAITLVLRVLPNAAEIRERV